MKRPLILLTGLLIAFLASSFSWFMEVIPKTWEMAAIKKFHLPPPDTTVNVLYAPESYYDSLPEHVIYKTYPVYIREFEKPGYLDSLRQLEPEVVFDPAKLKTPEDWIAAGKLIFNWPAAFRPVEGKASQVDAKYIETTGDKMTPAGIYPFTRYIIAEKGKLLWGSLSCASCHTFVTKSGELIEGAQGNGAGDRGLGYILKATKVPFQIWQDGEEKLNLAPWASAKDIKVKAETMEEFIAKLDATPGGVMTRQGGGFNNPLLIPSLIGIKDIKYLDRTGLMKHDGPADMMRYAAFNQGMDMLTSYNGYIPGGKNDHSQLPASREWRHPFSYKGRKYTDAQLYALTQYIYSLKPPKNPYRFPKSLLTRGELVFKRSGCVTCHTPPLYTNNKLTPANGFEPPKDHFARYDIFNVSVETDSVTALYTRRGTGYYKVPSLRSIWLQQVFFHNGNLASLEDVFDPARLRNDYVPTGFKPPHLKTIAVKGHEFGLELSDDDKKALIAFLRTL